MSKVLISPALVLNRSWRPIASASFRKAIKAVYKGRALIIDPNDFMTYDIDSWIGRGVESAEVPTQVQIANGVFIATPEVIVTTKFDKIPKLSVVFCRRNLWRRDGFRCFIPDTLILMSDGDLKPIQEIQIGDKVLDAVGQEQEVEHVFSKYVNEDLIKIRHRGNGDPIVCTSEHRIFTCDRYFENRQWLEAEKISSNCYLAELDFTKVEFTDKSDKLDLWTFCDSSYARRTDNTIETINGHHVISRHINCDNNLGKIVGYFLAEGSIDPNGIRFSFHAEETNYIEDVQKLLRSVFNAESKVYHYPSKQNLTQVFCGSSLLRGFFNKWCFYNREKRAKNKRYPSNYWKGVLYGILRGDSYIDENSYKVELMMKAENLIRDIYIIAQICGMRPTLSKTGIRSDGRIYKSIIFQSDEYNKAIQICGLRRSLYDKRHKQDRLYKEGSKIFLGKVRQISTINHSGLVYDLQISGSHSYVANFTCVHNCQYCGRVPVVDDITIDHIIPKSKGGISSFENCVLACITCNKKKNNRTIRQAGMRLVRTRFVDDKLIRETYDEPIQPHWSPLYSLKRRTYPASWKKFLSRKDVDMLYWETELET